MPLEVLFIEINARKKEMINEINRTMRSEKQATLTGTHTTTLSYRICRFRKDSYFYKILDLFYGNPTEEPKAYGIQQITKILNIAILTSQKWITILKRENLIRMVAKNVGTNKSEKFYMITNEGELLYESYSRSLLI